MNYGVVAVSTRLFDNQEFRVLFLNVQSPPKARAAKIAEYLNDYDVDALVLSELSSAEGSSLLLQTLNLQGYATYWTPPPARDYSVAIAIKNMPHKPMRWPVDNGRNRYQILRIRALGIELVLIGTYFPSLNVSNMVRRMEHAPTVEAFLKYASDNPARCVLFGGDINEIPPWHIPPIRAFSEEGYPLHCLASRIGLVDLAKFHLPAQSYSWYDRYGLGQLLDGMFISNAFKHLVQEYYLIQDFRLLSLTDHAGLMVTLAHA